MGYKTANSNRTFQSLEGSTYRVENRFKVDVKDGKKYYLTRRSENGSFYTCFDFGYGDLFFKTIKEAQKYVYNWGDNLIMAGEQLF